jgi:hypothetical protein
MRLHWTIKKKTLKFPTTFISRLNNLVELAANNFLSHKMISLFCNFDLESGAILASSFTWTLCLWDLYLDTYDFVDLILVHILVNLTWMRNACDLCFFLCEIESWYYQGRPWHVCHCKIPSEIFHLVGFFLGSFRSSHKIPTFIYYLQLFQAYTWESLTTAPGSS